MGTPSYLSDASLLRIMHDDPYCEILHQYCEHFLPLNDGSDGMYVLDSDAIHFVDVVRHLWLRRNARVDVWDQALNTNFEPPAQRMLTCVMVFITHVYVRELNHIRNPIDGDDGVRYTSGGNGQNLH